MKKFLACLFILAIFSGVVFYTGWTQFRVKPGQVGVVISKTHGIADKPVLNGEFSWHWQFLLPTNASVKTFEIKPVSVTKSVTGSLPSGDAYSSLFNAGTLFDYKLSFNISITVSPEAVVELLKLNKISDETTLTSYMEGAANTLAQLASDYILRRASDNPSFKVEALRRDEILKGVKIYKEFPELDVMEFSICESKLPDFAMYQRIREQVPDTIKPGLNNNNDDEAVSETDFSQEI